MKYILASGWWSCEAHEDTRQLTYGSDFIRSEHFHSLWRKSINKFCSPEEIIIVDSASPVKPDINDDIKWLELSENFGHATNHTGKYSGYSRAIFVSMVYAYFNDYDYWVYIEQDCLVYGQDIIENIIKDNHNKKIIYGNGQGTSQPIQQSFMIFHKDALLSFIRRYCRFNATDLELSPEKKFYFAANAITCYLPSQILKYIYTGSKNKYIAYSKNIIKKFISTMDQFGTISYGYGRDKPVDFACDFFYVQHLSDDEIEQVERNLANY